MIRDQQQRAAGAQALDVDPIEAQQADPLHEADEEARAAVDPALGAQIARTRGRARTSRLTRNRDEPERQHDRPEDGEAQPRLDETPTFLDLARHATRGAPRRGGFYPTYPASGELVFAPVVAMDALSGSIPAERRPRARSTDIGCDLGVPALAAGGRGSALGSV